jgi:hypothetical protein
MAKEIKLITVVPSAEESTINVWLSFGWDLKFYIGYIKLIFERDSVRQNYAELKSLEEQYYSVSIPHCPTKPRIFGFIVPKFNLINVFIAIASSSLLIPIIIILFSRMIGEQKTGIIFFFSLVCVGTIVQRMRSYYNEKKLWEKEYAAYKIKIAAARKNRQEILEKAKSLV